MLAVDYPPHASLTIWASIDTFLTVFGYQIVPFYAETSRNLVPADVRQVVGVLSTSQRKRSLTVFQRGHAEIES